MIVRSFRYQRCGENQTVTRLKDWFRVYVDTFTGYCISCGVEYTATVIDVHDDEGLDFTARLQFRRRRSPRRPRELADLLWEWVRTS